MEEVAEVELLPGELERQVPNPAPKGVSVAVQLLKGWNAPSLSTISDISVFAVYNHHPNLNPLV